MSQVSTNTKSIARKAGVTAGHVNEMARDLGIEMNYRSDLRHWDIVSTDDAARLLDIILDSQA